MSELVVKENNIAEETGRKLYQTNSHYRSLANVMEHPEFRSFIDKNFDDLTSAQAILIFIKLYQKIEKTSKITLSPYEKIAIVDEVINNSKLRQEIVRRIQDVTTTIRPIPSNALLSSMNQMSSN